MIPKPKDLKNSRHMCVCVFVVYLRNGLHDCSLKLNALLCLSADYVAHGSENFSTILGEVLCRHFQMSQGL